MLYDLLRPILFRLPAETAHHIATTALDGVLAPNAVREAVRDRFRVDDPALRITRWGIDFPNPVGLAAGFDKSGSLFNALGALGFGFVEIGTVTALPQPGNPAPRLFRLPADRALLNRMGFNNPGSVAVSERLATSAREPILGINIGKSKATPLSDATGDYLSSLERLERFADYLVVNVSSPNTPGLRSLQEAGPLRELLRALRERAAELGRARGEHPRPILLKISPDLSNTQIEEAVGIAMDAGAVGLVATNTTVSRTGLRTPSSQVDRLGDGGISGGPLHARALEVIGRVYRYSGGALPIIGAGGIFGAGDAWEFMRAGASLLQLYTGFIYRGPAIAYDINRGLATLLRRHGYSSLDEAVGSASRA